MISEMISKHTCRPIRVKEPATYFFASVGTFSGSFIYLFLYIILG